MISDAIKKEIDVWVKKYPQGQQRSAVMAALRLVQDNNGGYLSVELMDAVADYLKLERISVYEVATFYSFYNLKPIGKHKIAVCSNISCMLRGADQILEHLEKRCNTKIGETGEDGKYTLIREVECLGACIGAPMMQVNDKAYFEHLTPEKVDKILDDLEKNEGVK